MLDTSDARSPRLHRRSMARRAGSRRHTDFVVGHDFLHPGVDCSADRGRARLVDVVRHGRLLGRIVGGRAGRALCRPQHRPFRRSCGDDDRFADRRAGACPDRHCRRPHRLSRSLGRARHRHGGEPVRFRFRHARPHIWRRSTLADYRADIGRRLRLDRELAIDTFSSRCFRLARHLSGLCRAAGLHLSAAACAGVAARTL